MRELLKPFVLWLLLIAVPFQGYAAATMMCCGSAHSKGIEHTAQEPAMQSMHSHASNMDHDHDEDAVATGSATHSDAGVQHHDGDDSKRVAFKCSACASCCVGAAIVQTSEPLFDIASLDSIRISFHSRHFYRFVPDTLERPPYRLIA
jgi:hypothetical protein